MSTLQAEKLSPADDSAVNLYAISNCYFQWKKAGDSLRFQSVAGGAPGFYQAGVGHNLFANLITHKSEEWWRNSVYPGGEVLLCP